MTPRPTRAAGLDHLAAFAPRMGSGYAHRRGDDLGPGRHRFVSTLSPWLRRRLVTEPEVIRTAIDHHGPDRAAKFIQEVFWRGYFKGWLEHHPDVWHQYRQGLDRDLQDMTGDVAARAGAVMQGRCGIGCMDHWADELVRTGYLHNHARMWFASIWIFTLRLPWRVGADFFMRHLLDGDAASNTLSWRWVAGLHTNGRPYLADPRVIARHTEGRFGEGLDLVAEADPLPQDIDFAAARRPLQAAPPVPQDGPAILLIGDDDCGPAMAGPDLRGCALLRAGQGRSPGPVAAPVLAFDEGALADAGARLDLPLHHPHDATALADWAEAQGARMIVMARMPVGPCRDWLEAARPVLEERGIALHDQLRDWDRAVWPEARAGFFRLAKRIPAVLDQLDG
ncbi:deoxyribodipyrimidine photolyase [Paracoccus aestuarii]|uniref:Deoxyribodipyrimidine photolyase n=1 Tax=Paracoccus aestuarii TaxID=453842 RepID=A0A418ZZX6_9RHOB|nr:FAD-binding domain-containing protein [Paracoccus aestuarii]RJL06169.1 deoxyribodipyrimidine photolyase [Paracoccus aestuarii]WCQ98343.1 deoxyribodipyrimidine photolyase [Paracoccus aestuarii]